MFRGKQIEEGGLHERGVRGVLTSFAIQLGRIGFLFNLFRLSYLITIVQSNPSLCSRSFLMTSWLGDNSSQ